MAAEFRLVTEKPLGGGDSRVQRDEEVTLDRERAVAHAAYWRDRVLANGAKGWAETREVGLWEDFQP